MDCGRVRPRLRILSRLTSRMATSTTTSARVRSRSLRSFFGEDEVLGRGAHDDGVLRGDEDDLVFRREYVAQGGDDLVGVGLLGCVGEEEGLNGDVVDVVMLGGAVRRRRRWCRE